MQFVLKVVTVLRPIVCLHQSEAKAKVALRVQYDIGSNARPTMAMDLRIGHAAIQVNDRIHVAPALCVWTDVVNSTRFNEPSRARNNWSQGIIRADSLLPSVDVTMAF